MTDTVTDITAGLSISLELLDPKAITVRNIREPDPGLVDSVRRRGNHTPIRVVRTPDGELVLRFGGRRLQACIEAGREVLATVIDGTAGTTEAEIDRIFEQLDENDNRRPLTAGEHAVAVQTLLDFGVKPREITAQTGLGKTEIAAARQIAASQTAMAVAAQYPLDLEQTAAIAEFEDDPDVVEKLSGAAKLGKGHFNQRLQLARDNRADAQAIAAHAAKLTERGITVSDGAIHYENELFYWAGPDGARLTAETHAGCPGNVAVLQADRGHEVRERWFCTDPKANGHKRHRADSSPGQSPEEKQRVVEGNKAWRSAEKVRRAWLREFLGRPKAPGDALQFTLRAFALADYRLLRAMDSMGGGRHATARELLGIPKSDGSSFGSPPEVWTAMVMAGPDRARVIALAIVLGACEGATSVQTWRSPAKDDADYLEALARWGYVMSDIEQELVTAVREAAAARAAVIAQDETAGGNDGEDAGTPAGEEENGS